ncbi:MAG: FAD-dependent monooxygenase [Alphaproteobacteria bacterium]|nr:FAD-dependent monooxygenase [Alphaproteobacteria bacterium]MCB9693061.1 FAD-dependent monooxygenase [Alphaproteobacteria bacterium]
MSGQPVIVVGAGPVGLATAVALHARGREVVVLDARTGIPDDPRATTVQPRVLEIFDALGVLAPMLDLGLEVPSLQYFESTTGELLAELRYASIAAHTSCPYRLHLSQPAICRILYDALPVGTVRWGARVVDVKDDGEHAVVHLDGEETLVGSWVVGADGLNSTVRKAVGIGNETGSRASFLTCEADLELAQHLPERFGTCAYLFHGRDWVLAMRMRDCIRLLFPVPDGLTPRDAAKDENLLQWTAPLLGGELPLHALRDRAAYTVQQRLATTLRRGRVLLAGDAAHNAFPVGGMAMNAGIVDGYLLAHSLLVGTEAAIDAYGTERREQLREGILAETLHTMRTLSARGVVQRWSRRRALERLASDPTAARDHLLALSLL